MHREVIGEIARPAVVEVEEHSLSGLRSLRRDAGVDAVAIAMAARPGEAVLRRDRRRQARRHRGEDFLRLRVSGIEREHRRDLAMQQVIEVEAVRPAPPAKPGAASWMRASVTPCACASGGASSRGLRPSA